MLAGGMTTLFLATRALLGVGGRCAVGGPYEIRTECPPGVAIATPLSIFVALAGLILHIMGSLQFPGPRLWVYAWPALFGSLAVNFIDFGLVRPVDGIVVSFVVVGALFVAMAVIPFRLSRGMPRVGVGAERPDGVAAMVRSLHIGRAPVEQRRAEEITGVSYRTMAAINLVALAAGIGVAVVLSRGLVG